MTGRVLPAMSGEGETFTVEQHATREEWLAARMSGIGGSDAPCIWTQEITAAGGRTFGSPMTVYESKRGLRADDDSDAKALRRGQRAEQFIREEYSDETGRDVYFPGPFVLLRSIAHPFMSVSLDGWMRDTVPDASKEGFYELPGILECKRRGATLSWSNGIPLAIQAQIQHGLSVTGWMWGSAAVWLAFGAFQWGDVERREAWIAEHVERCRALWECVKAGTPPESDGHPETGAALLRLFPTDDGETVDLDDDAGRWAANWLEAREEMAGAEEAKRRYENKLRRVIGSASFGKLPDGRVLSLKTDARRSRVLRLKGERT